MKFNPFRRLVFTVTLFFAAFPILPSSQLLYPIKKIQFKNIMVNAEVITTESGMRLGLMFRKSLSPDSGMLFVFPSVGKYAFWMKNMRFPLDIIWIAHDKKVVAISAAVEPCTSTCEIIEPDVKAQYVLEVNSGFAKAHHIKIGDAVHF